MPNYLPCLLRPGQNFLPLQNSQHTFPYSCPFSSSSLLNHPFIPSSYPRPPVLTSSLPIQSNVYLSHASFHSWQLRRNPHTESRPAQAPHRQTSSFTSVPLICFLQNFNISEKSLNIPTTYCCDVVLAIEDKVEERLVMVVLSILPVWEMGKWAIAGRATAHLPALAELPPLRAKQSINL